METNNNESTQILTEPEVKQKNIDLVNQLHIALDDNKKGIFTLRRKLSTTFWTIIVLSIIVFAIGIVLLSVPVFAAFNGQIDNFNSLIAGGFGIANLIGLVLYGPMEKIHKLMGDMSQLILILNCNQTQTSLRLMEMDVNNRPSIGVTADKICSTTEGNIKSIQKYFEEPIQKTEKLKKTEKQQKTPDSN